MRPQMEFLATVQTPVGLLYRRFRLRGSAAAFVARYTDIDRGIWGTVTLIASGTRVTAVKGAKSHGKARRERVERFAPPAACRDCASPESARG